jgi:hypothetical protein
MLTKIHKNSKKLKEKTERGEWNQKRKTGKRNFGCSS